MASRKSPSPSRPSDAPPPRVRKPGLQDQLLPRGIATVVIGLAVLLSPGYIQSPTLREAVAGAYLVGWFAVVLGVALVGLHLVRRYRRKD